MIERHANILKDPKIKRIAEHDEKANQINLLDQRFYKRNGKYYPSVTSILNYFPKDRFFEDWIKNTGHNADIIVAKASAEGTQVHHAIERFVDGKEVHWLNDKGEAIYSLDVWKMILSFAEFWNTHKPELVASEYHVFSDEHEYAGTIDLLLKMDGKLWIVDIKTSNSLHTSHELQQAAYAIAWNETHNEKIDNIGLLWLKSTTRGPDKSGKKVQGAGWALKTFDLHYNQLFLMFNNIHQIYHLKNPDAKPYTESIPTSVKSTV